MEDCSSLPRTTCMHPYCSPLLLLPPLKLSFCLQAAYQGSNRGRCQAGGLGVTTKSVLACSSLKISVFTVQLLSNVTWQPWRGEREGGVGEVRPDQPVSRVNTKWYRSLPTHYRANLGRRGLHDQHQERGQREVRGGGVGQTENGSL